MLEALFSARTIDIVVPVAVVLGLIAILTIAILSYYRLSRRMTVTNVSVPVENREETNGTVVKCKYIGSCIIEWGVFVNKQRPIYSVHLDIDVEGETRRIKARVALADETDRVAANDAKCLSRRFGKGKPFARGEVLRVEYDKAKPKRGNIILQELVEHETQKTEPEEIKEQKSSEIEISLNSENVDTAREPKETITA